jgi:microcin C transport system ATP-binding protein
LSDEVDFEGQVVILVMRDGRVVEQGPTERIFEQPEQAYTRALMAAAFDLEPVEGGAVRT